MGIPKQEEQHWESFRTNQTRQKALCPKSLASLLLSHQHHPESDPYVYGVPCPQLNNSKHYANKDKFSTEN